MTLKEKLSQKLNFSAFCRSYINLANRFKQLDDEYMTLRSKIVPLLKQIKAYQQIIDTLKQEKSNLQADLKTLTLKYEELQVFEVLLGPEMQTLLEGIQTHIDRVDDTLKKIDQDDASDLTDEAQVLLRNFNENVAAFALPDSAALLNDDDAVLLAINSPQSPIPKPLEIANPAKSTHIRKWRVDSQQQPLDTLETLHQLRSEIRSKHGIYEDDLVVESRLDWENSFERNLDSSS